MSRSVLHGIALAATVLWSAAAEAQSFPTKPITIVVPSAAGGLSDGFVRLIGDAYQQAWGQPAVMDHRPGAGGIVGSEAVAKAVPDGHTLLMGNIGPLSINPGLYSSLPYDANKDFAAIALVATYPNVLVVHPDVPAKTVVELIDLAKKAPRTLNYGSAGVGQSQHLSGELFDVITGAQTIHVPYRGTGPALSDLLGGHIQMMFSNVPAAVAHIAAGKLLPLGVTGLTRNKALPNVPTLDEAGVPGYNLVSWLALVAPAKTPSVIIDQLHEVAVRALASPAGQKALEAQGAETSVASPKEVDAFFRAERDKWGKLIRQANIKAD
jgi:tripartite-type tricarboxylate transporter receptor subunit TctC